MANKRELKKFIRNTCGALALDMIQAGELFPVIESQDVQKVVLEAAKLQTATLRRIEIAFDRRRADFENAKEYAKARHEYYNKAYAALLDNFDKEVAAILTLMNQSLPEEVREVFKKAAVK
ncbi:MAG: hypothetical protein K2M55_06895 [Muribaculaceae bacterium]|nr:hypothetical protein [Muribaculaceae bacterium]